MIGIIDYGVGNISAISNVYTKKNISFVIIRDSRDVQECSHIILPGVGAFDDCMERYCGYKLRDIVEEKIFNDQTPILGICVGMQMLAETSEEGSFSGLGWIPDSVVKKFNFCETQQVLPLPHMGWNSIENVSKHSLFNNIDQETGFYFLHSFHFVTKPDFSLCTSNYGFDFQSAVRYGNIYGVQFHPEKSHTNGEQLLINFAEL